MVVRFKNSGLSCRVMNWGGFLSWYYQYFPFIWQNEIYHVIAGLLVVTTIYPFLGLKYKERKNYLLYLMIPALFGSVFPDFIFSVYTVVKNRGFYNIMNGLEAGTWLHHLFHSWWVFLVVPIAVVLVSLVVLLLELVLKRKSWKEITFPKFWWIWVLVVSLFCAILHIIMDTVGF